MSAQPRCAIVTGAAGTIGSAVARALSGAGMHLYIADVADAAVQARLAALADELRTRARRVEVAAADVARVDDARAIAAAAMKSFGRIDVLVNVAGVTARGHAADIAEADWDRVIDVNLKGTFFCCQSVIVPMRAQRFGRIVNIGSVNAKSGGAARPYLDPSEQARAANAAYSASKGGVHTLTLSLAKELAADGITVNAVAPGTIGSPMTANFPEALRRLIPVGRIGAGEEVAAAVRFLASDGAGFITGEILDVNGGAFMD
jgi:NAD(P)-dependent dehydrogenase (short-subunit alcohol dehydrogenase family)